MFWWEKTAAIAFTAAFGMASLLVYRDRGGGIRQGLAPVLPSIPYAAWLYRGTVGLAATGLVLAMLPSLDSWAFHHSAGVRWIGVGLVGTAFGLFFWAMRTLGTEYSPCGRTTLPTRIVVQGPYRWLRHPIYFSNWLLLCGICLVTGWLWLTIPVALYTVLLPRQAALEEAQLRHAFPEYLRYQQETQWL